MYCVIVHMHQTSETYFFVASLTMSSPCTFREQGDVSENWGAYTSGWDFRLLRSIGRFQFLNSYAGTVKLLWIS